MIKQILRRFPKAAPLLMALFVGTTPVSGQTATATAMISVTATVSSFCTITAQPLPFGTYVNVALNGTASLGVTCTNGSAYTVVLDLGVGTGATVASRKMTLNSGTAVLGYALYQDSARSVAWGPTVGTNSEAGTGTGALQTLTVYGTITGGQFVPVGNYTDTVTATINF